MHGRGSDYDEIDFIPHHSMNNALSVPSPIEVASIVPHFVLAKDPEPTDGYGLFAHIVRDEENREITEKLKAQRQHAAAVIRDARHAYRWLMAIGQPHNEGIAVPPTLWINKFSYTIPAHPWSNDQDDYVWGAELAVSNTLPGISTIIIKARNKLVAKRTLNQGEIFWGKESASDHALASERNRQEDIDFLRGIYEADVVGLIHESGAIYATRVPPMNVIGGLYATNEEITESVVLRRQEPKKA
jgi:hypothetical protein